MTKKMKKTRNRILIVLGIFVLLLVLSHLGILDPLPWWGRFLIYLVPYLMIGYDVLRKAVINISHGQVFDENFLMMIATFGAFGIGEYSEALAVMLFYQVGELFQSYAVGKSRNSIADMMSIAPESAGLVREDQTVEEVEPSEVPVGATIVVRAGEKVPLDGVVLEGSSFLDTAALTGESVPRRVDVGSEVISGCVNGDGVLRIRTTKAYEDSTVARILDLVENASNKKSRMENFITRFARYYTPVVTLGAVLLAVVPPLLGLMPFSDAIRRACIFLIVSCPCALVISVPLGFFGGIGAGSRIGVLVKGSNFLEAVAQADVFIFDKTGTLTRGEFRVVNVIPARDGAYDRDELLEIAAYGEGMSNHPIASSIRTCYGKNLELSRLSDAEEVAGKGIIVHLDGVELLLGNTALLQSRGITCEPCDQAGTIVYVAYHGHYIGCIVISDMTKDGAAEAIADLKATGVKRTIMLTGDRKEAAAAVANALSIDEVHAELLPTDKVFEVEKVLNDLHNNKGESGEKVAFVGDGINDAPVLMRADVGIAMGSLGSDAAIEAADIVLMDDDVRKIARIVRIARKTLRIVKQNIFFALAVKVIILVLGAMGLASMWLAVFGDVGVAVLAILNAMRTLGEDGKAK
ncbi:MAG: cadmium-translocating P-type ATPase [Butyrivibrio sp.]|nr:cadmium-translocating P-type ATPase [Butyrivibrio sp.]